MARGRARVELPGEVRQRVRACHAAIARLISLGDDAPRVYGVNTGFGALAETRIDSASVTDLQRNLVRSHSTGVGPLLGVDDSRAMVLLRAQTLAQGYSGVREQVVDLLVALLNEGVTPAIPSQGSVGASGDLAPLAHLAAVLIGEGRAHLDGEVMAGRDALARRGLTPIVLQAKEGLALINGTQFMTAIGALALSDAADLELAADVAGAMSLEALKGSERPFADRLMLLRGHAGQRVVASNLRMLLEQSAIMVSHEDCDKVQDPYSLRCMPQVHGASRDALQFARSVVATEVNAVTDNPSVFPSDNDVEVISGGNFHGQPVAFALDFAAIAVAELGNISERRVEQLVNPALSSGLTPFLASNSGLESGLMIAQVASASLVSENKVLCHPASVDSIPSSAGREDHVSMGSIGATKLRRVVDNVRLSLAIELLTAAQGLDQRMPLRPGRGVAAAHEFVRRLVPSLTCDRPLTADIEALAGAIRDGSLGTAVRSACVELR